MRFTAITVLSVASVASAFNYTKVSQSNKSTELDFDEEFSGLNDYVVDKKYSLLQLHQKLVSTPSVSLNEQSVAKWISGYLQDAGLTVEMQPVSNSTPNHNVYAYIGKTRSTSVLLTFHIDTVPPFIPYSVHGTEIRGRGTCDA